MWVRASAEKFTRNKYNPHKTRAPYNVKKTNGNKDGGRLRSMKKTATGEYGQTNRSIWKGAQELRQLSKGITESHVIEESKLFNTRSEIDTLLSGLIKTENKKHEDETQ